MVSSVRSLGSSRAYPSATKTFKAALRSCGNLGRDRQRNRRFFSGILRGVSGAREGSKILSFLFRLRLWCSSLLHPRSSGKVNSAMLTSCACSEVLHSPSPMRQDFSCGIRDSKLCLHTFSAKLAPNAHKCCGNHQCVEKETPRPSQFIADSSPFGNKAGMRDI